MSVDLDVDDDFLLDQAQFLTEFQHFYSLNDDDDDDDDDVNKDDKDNHPNGEEDATKEASNGGRRPPSSKSSRSISPQDLRLVFRYRDLCQQIQKLADDARISKLHDGVSPIDRTDVLAKATETFRKVRRKIRQRRSLQKGPDHDLKEEKERLEGENPGLLELVELVTRFEVWTCKAVSHQLLLSSSNIHHKKKKAPPPPSAAGGALPPSSAAPACAAAGFSSLLHIPTSHHMQAVLSDYATIPKANLPQSSSSSHQRRKLSPFADVWNEVYNKGADKDYLGGPHLAVSPDVNTWPEFLRVAYMVGALPTEGLRDKVHASLCASGRSGGKERCHVKYHFRSTDLVALWVRAQFCSVARRYLHELFEIVPVDPSAPENQRNGDSGGAPTTMTYKAVYRGNHRNMAWCFSEPPLVDSLAKFAIINQVLFTQPKVLQAWKHGLAQRDARSRRPSASSAAGQGPGPSNKRRKYTMELSKWECERLLRACQSFLLRDYCRRHPVLCVLLYASSDEYEYAHQLLFERDDQIVVEPSVLLHHPLAKAMIDAEILNKIRDHPLYKNFSDRKIPRIDRRIAFGRCKWASHGVRFGPRILTLTSCYFTIQMPTSWFRRPRLKPDTSST
jgi:hypothetical protein